MWKDGQSCSSQQEVLQWWCEHYSEVLNHPAAPTCQEPDAQLTVTDNPTIPTDAPTLSKVESAIKKLKLGRAPGGDCIAPEMAKLAPASATFALHDLLGKVWTSGHIPSELERRHHNVNV